MTRLLISLAIFAGLAATTAPLSPSAKAASVALFYNNTFVDVGGKGDGYPGEAAALRASLTLLGHTVTTFSGFTAADFDHAANSANLIVFPEFAGVPLPLDAAAVAALRDYVLRGGGVVVLGGPLAHHVDLLNLVFEFSLVDAWLAIATFPRHDMAAAGTPFATAPAVLPINSDTFGVAVESLPDGALNLYSATDLLEGGEDVVVFVAEAGLGKVGYLGWDWFDARPLGSEDGGWLAALHSMVLMTAGVITDIDADNDGAPDTRDQCANTPANVAVNEHGCSIDQLVPCTGPLGGGAWKSHGDYLRAFSRVADSFYSAQIIDRHERDQAVKTAVRSNCGKK